MLHWAILFLLVALFAGMLGFGGVTATAAGLAQVMFFVFVVLFVLSLLRGLMSRG